jgi:hypothetical protein
MSAATLIPTPEAILAVPFPSYLRPLGWAHQWLCSGDPERKQAAVELLRRLYERYDHAVAVGQELVLALMESGPSARAEAEAALQAIDARFAKLDEELLCRWGRFYKEYGDRYLGVPWLAAAVAAPPNPEEARPFYLLSLEKYTEARRLRQGHYPGINQATLLFLLGNLVRRAESASTTTVPTRELAEAQALARRLLDGRDRWHEWLPNDRSVWHPATAAEAHLLLQEWDQAAREYRVAVANSQGAPRDFESMGRQAFRILLGWNAAGATIPESFTRLDTLFPGMPP